MAKKLKGDSFFLSANDLKTGSVVYYNGDDWSEKVYKAKKINRSEIEEYENIAKKFEDECIIISPIFVELNDDGTIKKLRDIIRKKWNNLLSLIMYQYSDKDKQIVKNRTKEFLSQVKRRIDGNLTEEEFKPLRLMNGLYLQLHAYMLRVAIPYGELSHIQLNKLAEISEKYDKGYGHFTTRQNIQFNWPKLEDVPKILNELADVEMHAIQTSGNCIRNISCDHLAGINNEEVEDPRPWCEIIRKWSTFHPEFSYLPRKFKIAVIASETDRAAMKVHDIGLKLTKKKKSNRF